MSFGDAFGHQQRRKRPNVGTSCLDEMITRVEETNEDYDAKNDKDLHKFDLVDARQEVSAAVFFKG